MAHEILGDRFMSRSKPAWHNLGVVFGQNEVISPSEAVTRVAGDITVEAKQAYYQNDHGDMIPIKDYRAIVRGPVGEDKTEKVFGVTSDAWHTVNYPSIAKALDPLSETYKVETCGLIEDGSLCFLALRGPDFSVKGDEMNDYFVANLSNKPGNAHKVIATPVRVVCKNTNMLSQDKATISLAVQHSAKAAERIQMAANLVAQFREMTTKTQMWFQAFADKQITIEGLNAIFQAAFPNPAIPTELRLFQQALGSAEQGAVEKAMGAQFQKIVKAQEQYNTQQLRVKALRDTAMDRFEAFNPVNLRGTVWAAYNAVTEVADWREGRGADVASVWGNRAREKASAFAASMALVNN